MHKQRHPLKLIAVFFLTILTIGMSGAAHANDCYNSQAVGGNGVNPSNPNDPNGLGGVCVGGYGCNGQTQDSEGNAVGVFTGNYENSAAQTTQKRAMAKWRAFMDADSIDAKALYCWQQIKLIIDSIAWTGNPKAIIIFAIQQLINQIINNLCQQVLNIIRGAVKAILSIFNQFLCLPIPKLNLPHFSFGFGTGHCQGTQLAQFGLIPPGTGNNNKNVIWRLWGNQQQQQ